MTNTDTSNTARSFHTDANSYFVQWDVPSTCSTYRLLVHHHPDETSVSVALLNFGTSAEFGYLPTHEAMTYSVAEHLTKGNLVDAANLIAIFEAIAIEKGW